MKLLILQIHLNWVTLQLIFLSKLDNLHNWCQCSWVSTQDMQKCRPHKIKQLKTEEILFKIHATVFFITKNAWPCIEHSWILDPLHNLHVIRNDLQSDIMVIVTQVFLTVRPQTNFSATDSAGTFSITVHTILLILILYLKQNPDGGFNSKPHAQKWNWILLLAGELRCTARPQSKCEAEALLSQHLTSWHTN